MKITKKELGKSKFEIEVELTPEEFSVYFDRALDRLKNKVKMDGFRQGTAPKEMVERHLGAENVLMEAGDLAVKESYARYINENNIEPVGNPHIHITKIAKGSPMSFTAEFSVLPEVVLPDYKAIAKNVKAHNIGVDEKEIEDALAYLQKSRAKFLDKDTPAQNKDYVKIEYQNEHVNSGKPVKDMFILGESGFLPDFENSIVGMKTGEEKEFSAKFPESAPKEVAGKEGIFKVKMLAVQTMELPGINDEFAKSLGVFDSLVALKENLKEGIGAEKKEAEKQRYRGEILASIAEKMIFELPEVMVEYEQQRLLEDLKNQVAQQFKIPFEEYLKSTKKTEEELQKGMRSDAERRIKNYLVLRQVGKAENIEVSSQEIEEEMNRFARKYTKEQIEKIDISELKEYTKSAIFNEKVFQKLETFSG